MAHPFWPLFDLRIATPRLEIRYPDDDTLVALAHLAAAGVHDPGTMPFTIPWTDTPSPHLERNSLQFWWRKRAEWRPDDWTFTGAVFVDGRPVGVQDLIGTDFGRLRVARTGSWLGRPFQGTGIGREMRAAIVHLAFAGLGAVECLSGAFSDNDASRRVSESLGYRPNGTQLVARRDRPDRVEFFVLDREHWERGPRPEVRVTGLEPCLPLFGLDGA